MQASSCPATCSWGRNESHLGSPPCPSRLCVPDAISSTNPRVIDDARARKLSSDLKRCTYYETCATYGLNVERVFQDGKYSTVDAAPPSRQQVPRPRGGLAVRSERRRMPGVLSSVPRKVLRPEDAAEPPLSSPVGAPCVTPCGHSVFLSQTRLHAPVGRMTRGAISSARSLAAPNSGHLFKKVQVFHISLRGR